jgi:hypothetical protein
MRVCCSLARAAQAADPMSLATAFDERNSALANGLSPGLNNPLQMVCILVRRVADSEPQRNPQWHVMGQLVVGHCLK